MVGVVEHDLDTQLLKRVLWNAFHASQSSNRHEDRRFDLSVRGYKTACTGAARGRLNLK